MCTKEHTYGRTGPHEGTADRPLVTFAVFAYNQQRFVADAVRAALSQTYRPLEIILSDDCSSDQTFQLMDTLASEYRGPHSAIVRRNGLNLGTAQHVQAVAERMNGELLVVAAGDDISRPDRTAKLVHTWLAHDRTPVVLHSWLEAFRDGSVDTGDIVRFRTSAPITLQNFARVQRAPILSPTAAYKHALFSEFPPLIGGSLIEDGPLIFRGLLSGAFAGVPEPLVRQRKLEQSAGTGFSIENPRRWNAFVRSKIISQTTKLRDLHHKGAPQPEKSLLERRFQRDIRGLAHCMIAESSVQSFASRAKVAARILTHYPNSYSPIHKLGFAARFARLV